MRGIDGLPADTDRDTGSSGRSRSTRTSRSPRRRSPAGTHQGRPSRSTTSLGAGTQFDGVWTSGIDASIVDAFKTAKQPFMPIVGADNDAFVSYLDSEKANGLSAPPSPTRRRSAARASRWR